MIQLLEVGLSNFRKNIGIRMILRLTENMTYHNDAGVNTLLMLLRA